MTDKFLATLNTYTEEQQGTIKSTILAYALAGNNIAPETAEQFKSFCDQVLEKEAKKEAEETKKKAIQLTKKLTKAEELGMTLEEYEAYKKLQAKKARYKREIKKAEIEIEKLKKEIQWKKEYLEKLEKRG